MLNSDKDSLTCTGKLTVWYALSGKHKRKGKQKACFRKETAWCSACFSQ